MLVASLLSLVLMVLAGVLMDAHRRDWAAARLYPAAPPPAVRHPAALQPADDSAAAFERRRVRRRTVATGLIAVVGLLVALWPVTPREPGWVLAYAGGLASLAMAILSLGVWDAWASAKHYRNVSRRRLAEHAEQLREAIEHHRVTESEGAGA